MAFHIEKVHRTTSPVGLARLLAEEFCHDGTRRTTDAQAKSVVAIPTKQVVVRCEATDGTSDRGLLTDVEVAIPADPVARVLLLGTFLEPTNLDHHPVETTEFLIGHMQVRGGARRRDRTHYR